MIVAVIALLLGVGMPWFVLSEKDQRLGQKHLLGRGEFVLWFCLTLAIVMGKLFLALLVPGIPSPRANALALGLSLAYVATRRLRDLNASPWWALLGLVWPFSLAGHLLLMLLPGRKKS